MCTSAHCLRLYIFSVMKQRRISLHFIMFSIGPRCQCLDPPPPVAPTMPSCQKTNISRTHTTFIIKKKTKYYHAIIFLPYNLQLRQHIALGRYTRTKRHYVFNDNGSLDHHTLYIIRRLFSDASYTIAYKMWFDRHDINNIH